MKGTLKETRSRTRSKCKRTSQAQARLWNKRQLASAWTCVASPKLLNKQMQYACAMQQMGISGDQLTMSPSHQGLSLPFHLPIALGMHPLLALHTKAPCFCVHPPITLMFLTPLPVHPWPPFPSCHSHPACCTLTHQLETCSPVFLGQDTFSDPLPVLPGRFLLVCCFLFLFLQTPFL